MFGDESGGLASAIASSAGALGGGMSGLAGDGMGGGGFSFGGDSSSAGLGGGMGARDALGGFGKDPAVSARDQLAEVMGGSKKAPEAPGQPAKATDAPARDPLAAAIANAHAKYSDLPSGYLGAVAKIESSMNPRARNKDTGASGAFQFLGSTAKAYGVKDPFDPEESAMGAARLAQDNARYFEGKLGRAPTGRELYGMHQQGMGGFTSLVSNPDKLARDIVGTAAVTLNGGHRNMTAGEFADLVMSKYDWALPQPLSPEIASLRTSPIAPMTAMPGQTSTPTAPASSLVAQIMDLLGGAAAPAAPAARGAPEAPPAPDMPALAPRTASSIQPGAVVAPGVHNRNLLLELLR